jgi:hypothetical protein
MVVPLSVLCICGCGIHRDNLYADAIGEYHARAVNVRLGDTKDNALRVLLPTQQDVPPQHRRSPEQFNADSPEGSKSLVEIYYLRSGKARFGDLDLNTDDELTPYVFRDGILTSIGWTALGGPKTRAEAPRYAPGIVQQQAPAKTNFTCTTIGMTTQCD